MRRTALLLLLVTGCSGKRDAFLTVFDPCEPLVLSPAADATPQQLASVSDAIALWNAVEPTRLTLDATSGARTLPILFDDSQHYLGFYDDRAEEIRLARRVVQEEAMAVVLAHELGHAFDLYHVKDRDSVMRKGNWTIPPLQSDAAALEAVWGLCGDR